MADRLRSLRTAWEVDRPTAERSFLSDAKAEDLFDSAIEIDNLRHVFCETGIADLQSAVGFNCQQTALDGDYRSQPELAGFAEAVLLGRLLRPDAVLWRPARILSSFSYFNEAIESFLNSGPFPVLCTVHFEIVDGDRVQTDGLAWFCGQEVVFEFHPLEAREALRRALRLSHSLIVDGCISEPMTVSGLFDGEFLAIDPSPDRSIIEVSIVSMESADPSRNDPSSMRLH